MATELVFILNVRVKVLNFDVTLSRQESGEIRILKKYWH